MKCGGLRIAWRQSGIPVSREKGVQEALLRSLKTRFLIAFQGDSKTSVDEEFAFTLHNTCG